MLGDSMRPSGALATVMLLLIQLICFKHIHAQESGTVIPAESKTVCIYRRVGQAIYHFMSSQHCRFRSSAILVYTYSFD